jgi:hypothetical protein
MNSNNIYINVRKAIVLRSHQEVVNGATVGLLAGSLFEKTGALKVGVRMSGCHIFVRQYSLLEVHRPILLGRMGLRPRRP